MAPQTPAQKYHWPSKNTFNANEPSHQGWALFTYTSGVFGTVIPNFDEKNEDHRAHAFNLVSEKLGSKSTYRIPEQALADGLQNPQAAATSGEKEEEIDWLFHDPNALKGPDPLMAQRLKIVRGAKRETDARLGRYVLSSVGELVQSDIDALKDLTSEVSEVWGLSNVDFLTQIFTYGDEWDSSVRPPRLRPATGPMNAEQSTRWNQRVFLFRARWRLYVWYNLGKAVPLGGNGTPVYEDVKEIGFYETKWPER